MSIIAFSSAIGPVALQCILSEDHSSSIEITGNPIETGAEVNDHAYVRPKEVTLEIADGNAAAVHSALVAFQESRVPFVLVTGLRLYEDMLVQNINVFRDKDNFRILQGTIDLKQVIIVDTATAEGSETSSTNSNGSAKKAKSGGDKSRSAVTPSKSSANNSTTADRTSGTVTRGDTPAKTVAPSRNQSIAKSVFG